MSLHTGPRSQAAVDMLLSQGLSYHPKPSIEIPILPSDLTALDDENLMILYSQLTAWSDFVSTQVSCAQVDERAAEKRLSHAEALMMASETGGKVTFARAQIAADPKILAMKETVEEAHAYRKIVESIGANIERDAALVSRELTRRTTSSKRSNPNRWSA
jgi:hypothetical protein